MLRSLSITVHLSWNGYRLTFRWCITASPMPMPKTLISLALVKPLRLRRGGGSGTFYASDGDSVARSKGV